jgi:hypothetical protein
LNLSDHQHFHKARTQVQGKSYEAEMAQSPTLLRNESFLHHRPRPKKAGPLTKNR